MTENSVSRFGTTSNEKKTELVNIQFLKHKEFYKFAFNVLDGSRRSLSKKIIVKSKDK